MLGSTLTQAECIQKQDVYVLPTQNIAEFCFQSEIVEVVFADSKKTEFKIQNEKLPPSYTEKTIKAVLLVKPLATGFFSNFYVDTKDGQRKTYTYIAVSNSMNESK